MQLILKNSFRFFKGSHSTKFEASKNYYELLNIKQNSSKAMIRNAYLTLAKKYHPDVNPNGKQQFTLIQQAYKVLSDQNQKKQYDEFYYSHVRPRQSAQSDKSRTSNYSYRSSGTTQDYYKQYHKSQNQYQGQKKRANFKGQQNMYGNSDNHQENQYDYDHQPYQDHIIKKRRQWTKQFYEKFGMQNQKQANHSQGKAKKTKEDQEYQKVQYSFSSKNPFGPKITQKEKSQNSSQIFCFANLFKKIKGKFD